MAFKYEWRDERWSDVPKQTSLTNSQVQTEPRPAVLRYTDEAGWDECGWSLQGLCDALILPQKSADRRGCKTVQMPFPLLLVN